MRTKRKLHKNKRIRLFIGGFIVIAIILITLFGKWAVHEQQIRDKCYAVGIHAMPPTTDQSMLQGVPAYQDCIKSLSGE